MSEAAIPQTPPRRKGRVSWKRVAIGLGSSLFLLGSVGWFLYPWGMAISISVAPGLQLLPEEVPDKTIAKLSEARLTLDDCAFQVPWSEVEQPSNKGHRGFYKLQGGYSVLAMKALPGTGFASEARTVPVEKRRALAQFSGDSAMGSDYQLLDEVLKATPNQIRWWTRTRNVRTAGLLELKWTHLSSSEAVYRIGNDEVKGFEFIGWLGRPQLVKLEFFDRQDNQFELIIARSLESAPISQAQINAIIASFRPIPHS